MMGQTLQPANRMPSGKGPGKAATQFKPGQSGNPAGRSSKIKAVEDAARAHTTLAISTLAEVCRSKRHSASARVVAAVALLDRGWGRPKQSIEATMSFDLAELMRRGRERALLEGEAVPVLEVQAIEGGE